MHSKPIAFIRELCKHKTEDEICEAEQNFREYLMLVKDILDDIENTESQAPDKGIS